MVLSKKIIMIKIVHKSISFGFDFCLLFFFALVYLLHLTKISYSVITVGNFFFPIKSLLPLLYLFCFTVGILCANFWVKKERQLLSFFFFFLF